MKRTEILVTRNGGDFKQKGQRKREKSVAVIIDIEEKKIWDELGFLLGVGSCGLFNLWTENLKFKKIKLQA